MGQAVPVPFAIVLVAALLSAVTDIWRFKVHNVVTLPLLITGLVYHGLVGGSHGLAASLSGALFGFGALITFYVMGGMGGGDVKLMAAIGAWLGIEQTFYVFIASSLAAGLYAAMLLCVSGKLAETWVNLRVVWLRLGAIGRYLGADDRLEAQVRQTDRRHRLIPFAAMIALGVIAALVWAKW